MSLRDAALDAVRATYWLCDDGHRHRRPERFALNRLVSEINRRNPRNPWMGSEMACAVYDLIDEGALLRHPDFRLEVARDAY